MSAMWSEPKAVANRPAIGRCHNTRVSPGANPDWRPVHARDERSRATRHHNREQRPPPPPPGQPKRKPPGSHRGAFTCSGTVGGCRGPGITVRECSAPPLDTSASLRVAVLERRFNVHTAELSLLARARNQARSRICCARSRTGLSTMAPSTTPTPSLTAPRMRWAQVIWSAEGANAWCTTGTCEG
jgi:hypothetical protein